MTFYPRLRGRAVSSKKLAVVSANSDVQFQSVAWPVAGKPNGRLNKSGMSAKSHR